MSIRWTTTGSFLLLLLVSYLPNTVTQTISILPTVPSSTFPTCAFACTNLNAAASYCIETNVGASQQTVNSCFCQRAELTPFYIGSTGVCDAFCLSDSDRSVLQTWFQSYCAAAGFGEGGGATVTTLVTSTRAPTSSATGSSQINPSTGSPPSSPDNGWFASHWRWILMLIVLIVGLSALAVLAIYLKRRHTRKLEERRAALSGFPAAQGASSPHIGHGQDMWGPHQHMAHTRGWEYTAEQDRELRAVSIAADVPVLGSARAKTKSSKGHGKRRLSKRSKHGETETVGLRAEDENTRNAKAAVRRSRSEQRREREVERVRDKEVERGLRGWPIQNHYEETRKTGQKPDMDETWKLEISEKDKDIS